MKDSIHSFRKGIISSQERDIKLSKVNAFLLEIIDEVPDKSSNLRPLVNSLVSHFSSNSRNDIIEIPKEVYKNFDNSDLFFLDFTLEFRETKKRIKILSPDNLSTGKIVNYLVQKVFPDFADKDYDWYLEFNGLSIPKHHTLFSAGVKSGDVINLSGEHRKPKIMWKKVARD